MWAEDETGGESPQRRAAPRGTATWQALSLGWDTSNLNEGPLPEERRLALRSAPVGSGLSLPQRRAAPRGTATASRVTPRLARWSEPQRRAAPRGTATSPTFSPERAAVPRTSTKGRSQRNGDRRCRCGPIAARPRNLNEGPLPEERRLEVEGLRRGHVGGTSTKGRSQRNGDTIQIVRASRGTREPQRRAAPRGTATAVRPPVGAELSHTSTKGRSQRNGDPSGS